MPTYVFSLGLIPVQEWIAQARRSRDLRAGSAFLCHLMARALTALAKDKDVEILLPREPREISFVELAELERALTAPYGIPNRASGYCEAAGRDDVARRLDAATRGTLAAGWEEFRNRFLRPSDRAGDWEVRFWRRIAEPLTAYRQATPHGEDCPFTFVWVAAPARAPRDDRRGNLLEIERLHADVKRSRPVRPGLEGRPIGKCNQCGAREAIGPSTSFEDWRDWYTRLGNDIRWVEEGVRIDPGERLCYVCLAKRMAGYLEGVAFPSTGIVAAAPWLCRARSDTDLKALLGRLETTAPGRADLARTLRSSPRELEADGATDAAGCLRDLRAWIQSHPKLGLRPLPPAYLALLTFDGDDMGRHVREDPDSVPKKMADFAQEARALLLRYRGEAFYLAGDEGLAMAPAEAALDLALALRKAFRGAFGEAVTLSMGIAFFEHSRPMAGAIRAARAALERAKDLDAGGRRKDGLGVTVATASGNLWSLAERWGVFWDRLRTAAGLVRKRRLSAGWAYDVETFLETIPGEAWRDPGLPAAVRAEVKRLFFRRFEADRATAEERRREKERAWREDLHGEDWWAASPGELPRPLPEQLHLIGFLGRQRAIEVPDGEPAPAVPEGAVL
jgi:CRISPR-associated protein Cmr2